jgi:hypothetical protein
MPDRGWTKVPKNIELEEFYLEKGGTSSCPYRTVDHSMTMYFYKSKENKAFMFIKGHAIYCWWSIWWVYSVNWKSFKVIKWIIILEGVRHKKIFRKLLLLNLWWKTNQYVWVHACAYMCVWVCLESRMLKINISILFLTV